jgi:hypothetical protein
LCQPPPAPSANRADGPPDSRGLPPNRLDFLARVSAGRAKLGWRNDVNSANRRVSLRRNAHPGVSLLKTSNHDHSSLKLKTPLNSQTTTVSSSQGEAPAAPHPCRERCTDPCCSVKTPAITHSADHRSVARHEPRPPESSPVQPRNSRELQCHWASAHPICRKKTAMASG